MDIYGKMTYAMGFLPQDVRQRFWSIVAYRVFNQQHGGTVYKFIQNVEDLEVLAIFER